MTFLSDCSPCPGGANPVHLINPDPNVNVIVVSGGTIFHPQRIDPGQICFDALRNTRPDVISTLPQGLDPGQVQPLLWNPDTCCVEGWLPPCPEVQSYDPGSATDPGPVDLTTFPVGTTTFYAHNLASDCIDQVWDCAAEVWRPFCGGQAVVGPTLDLVCYDVTSWGAPNWDYDNISGLWNVLGINRITETCTAGPAVTVFPDAANTEITTGEDTYAGTGPPLPGFFGGLIGWQPMPGPYIPNGTATGEIGYLASSLPPIPSQSTNNAQRATIRTNFGVLPGSATGPLRYQLNYADPNGASGAGTLRYAAWDSVSNQLMPIINNAGAGTIVNQPGGQSIYAIGIPAGTLIDFTVQLPGTVDPANVYLLFWNAGHVDNDEVHDNIRLTYQPTVSLCCNDWTGVADLAAYLNMRDPNGSGWSIDPGNVGNPNLICREVTLGAGAQYGQLNGCSTPPVLPTVTQI